MNPRHTRRATVARTAAGLLGIAALAASAQTDGGSGTPSPSSGTPSGTQPSTTTTISPAGAPPGPFAPIEASPWYIGVNQGLTHDTNVFRTPNGPSDTVSSTSLVGGFDQPLGRQRLLGAASVSYNRYFSHSDLNNTAYNLNTGIDWQTVGNLSGNLGVSLNRNLASPVTSGSAPIQHKNVADTRGANGSIRWGGSSSLSLEGTAGYVATDYSAPEFTQLESSQSNAGVALRYHSGAPWGVGIGTHYTHQRTPRALQLANGSYEGNTSNGRNIDLLVDYSLGPTLNFNGRVSYTRQTNTGISNADFSGVTGNAALGWQITGKTSVNAYFSRDTGFNTTPFKTQAVFFIGPTPVISSINGLYENNQVTTTAGIGASWAATGKITANVGARYARARLVSTLVVQSGSQAAPDTLDISKVGYIGASWSVTRAWNVGCNLSHELRDVSGRTNYSFTDTLVGCSAQYTWR